MKYLFLLSFSMFSCSHKSAKESNNQVAISHEGGPSTEQEGNQRQEASPELEQSGSKQESNSVDAENPLSSSLPPYSTSCSEYPCYYRQNKVPPNTFITNGIIGYDVKGTYEFDFRTGVPKYPNNTGDSRKATIPRGRILVLSDGRVVIRANNGAINWFKDQVAQFSVMTLTADEIKTGSNFPLGTLALMADDSIVSANKSGDIRWFKDGKLIHEEKKSDIVNLLELPGDRLAILQRTSISVFSKTKLESEIQITSDLINASIFASMNLSTFAISTKKDGIDFFKIITNTGELLSIPSFKADFVRPITSNSLIAIGVQRYRHQNRSMIFWINENKIVREYDFEDNEILTQPEVFSDGSILLSIRPSKDNKPSRLVRFKNEVETLIAAPDAGIDYDFQAPVITSDEALIYLSRSKLLTIWNGSIKGYSKPLVSGNFWPPTILPDGTLVAQSGSGLVQWLKPVRGSGGFFERKDIKTAFKVTIDRGSSSICPHSTSSQSVQTIEAKFVKIGSLVILDSKSLGCNGTLSANIVGDSFHMSEYQTSDCRVSIAGTIDSQNVLSINKYHRETCRPDLSVGFNWSVMDLSP